jgi:hypothetical protein
MMKTMLSFAIGLLAMVGCTKQNKHLMGHGEKVLVIGRHESMLNKVTDMLKQQGYEAVGKHSTKKLSRPLRPARSMR